MLDGQQEGERKPQVLSTATGLPVREPNRRPKMEPEGSKPTKASIKAEQRKKAAMEAPDNLVHSVQQSTGSSTASGSMSQSSSSIDTIESTNTGGSINPTNAVTIPKGKNALTIPKEKNAVTIPKEKNAVTIPKQKKVQLKKEAWIRSQETGQPITEIYIELKNMYLKNQSKGNGQTELNGQVVTGTMLKKQLRKEAWLLCGQEGIPFQRAKVQGQIGQSNDDQLTKSSSEASVSQQSEVSRRKYMAETFTLSQSTGISVVEVRALCPQTPGWSKCQPIVLSKEPNQKTRQKSAPGQVSKDEEERKEQKRQKKEREAVAKAKESASETKESVEGKEKRRRSRGGRRKREAAESRSAKSTS